MEIGKLAAIGVVLLIAAVGQSAVGFGFALFATPALVWLGVDLPHAIALVSTCSMIQSAMGARELRASVPAAWALWKTNGN